MKKIVLLFIGMAFLVTLIPASAFADASYVKNLNVTTESGKGTSKITQMKGDFDSNGVIDEQDQETMLNLMSKNLEWTQERLEIGDYNSDDLIDSRDLSALLAVLNDTPDTVVMYKALGVPNPYYHVSAIAYKGQAVNVPTKTTPVKTTAIGGETLTATLIPDGSVEITGITNGKNGTERTLAFHYKSESSYLKNLVATSDKNGEANVTLMKFDMDNDGDIDADDIETVDKLIAKNLELTADRLLKADVNCDGVVDVLDKAAINGIVSGGATKTQIYHVVDTPKADYKVTAIELNGQTLKLPSKKGESIATTIDGKAITVTLQNNGKTQVTGIFSGTSGVEQTIKFTHEKEDTTTGNGDNQNDPKGDDKKTDGKNKNTKGGGAVQTGDESQLLLYVLLMAAAAAAIIVVLRKRKLSK